MGDPEPAQAAGSGFAPISPKVYVNGPMAGLASQLNAIIAKLGTGGLYKAAVRLGLHPNTLTAIRKGKTNVHPHTADAIHRLYQEMAP